MYYAWILKKGKPSFYGFVKARSWPGLKKVVIKEMKKTTSLKWGFVEYLRNGQRTITTFGWSRTLKNWPELNPFAHVSPDNKHTLTLPVLEPTKLHPLKRGKAPSPRGKKRPKSSPTKAKRPSRSRTRR